MASEIRLLANRTFEFAMMYGGAEMYASGIWNAKGGKVVLEAKPPSGSPTFRAVDPEKISLRKLPAPGKWVAIVSFEGFLFSAPVAFPMEAVFESATGKRVAALTNRFGDAIADAIDNEKWVRTGLRVAGAGAEPQWFPVPDALSDKRIASYLVDDFKWAAPPPFQELALRKSEDALIAEGMGLTYVRLPD